MGFTTDEMRRLMASDISRYCAFTGHRPHKLPWKYNEGDARCVALKTALKEQIIRLAEAGITEYYSGGAEGIDCIAAEIVLELRKKNPALRLYCILPYEGQADKWSNSAQERYRLILKQADSVEYVSREYYNGCITGLRMTFGSRPVTTSTRINFTRKKSDAHNFVM